MIRMDYGHDEFYTALAEEAMTGWDRWNEAWGRPLFHQDGFLLMAREPMEDGTFEGDSFRLLESRGHRPRRVGPEERAERFPEWRSESYLDGYFNSRAGWAESGAVVARVLREARAAGVSVEPGRRMTRLVESGSRVSGVMTDDGSLYEGHAVVVAAGAWTPTLLPWLGDRMWAIGQPVLHFRIPSPQRFQPPTFPPWAADLSNTGWYGFPSLDDGTLKVANHGPGDPVDPNGNRKVAPESEERFREFFRASLPGLVDAPVIARRLCLYCDTFDSDFWIDADPTREGLVVAAGGSGHGFKFLPVLGGLVADRVEGVENRWGDRFRWREAGARRTEAARFDG
jgi:glycine/D-amino acid oxidase-like deaminating enzyme